MDGVWVGWCGRASIDLENVPLFVLDIDASNEEHERSATHHNHFVLQDRAHSRNRQKIVSLLPADFDLTEADLDTADLVHSINV